MITLQYAADIYLQLSHAEDTIRGYRSRLNKLIRYFGPDRDLASISHADLIAYFHSFRKEVKPITEWNYMIATKTFFKWCVEVEYLPLSPAQRLKLPKHNPEPLEMKAIPRHILDDMQRKAQLKRKRGAAVRDYAILCFLDETACRRGAVARLMISKLDLVACEARAIEKGGELERLTFTERTVEALRAWLAIRPKCDHDYVFTAFTPSKGYPALNRESISIMFRRLSKKVSPKTYGPHSCRHQVAQDMKNNRESTAIIQDKLNHKHLVTTETYLRRSDDQVREATRRRAERIEHREPERNKIIYIDFAS